MGRQDGSTRQVSLESVDSSSATILHLDLDAFFASVELLDHPELVHLPVVVSHDSVRAVVTAANYPARKFGVRSAMPLSRAKRLCPTAVIMQPHFEKYRYFSNQVMSILTDTTPLVERMSIDEAFLDVAGAMKLSGSPFEIGASIRQRVFESTGLTCSIGAAATKFVAKLASGLAKPDGLLVIPQSETLRFLHPLPASSLWGVGAATEKSLQSFGLHTIQDIAQTPVSVLKRLVGDAVGSKLHDLSNGRDDRKVVTSTIEKSIGNEVTFEVDVSNQATLKRELLRQAFNIGKRLRQTGLVARTVSLKLRTEDFTTLTRSRTLDEPTQVSKRIANEVIDLFDKLKVNAPVRLIGARVEQLSEASGSSFALWDEDEEWREAEKRIDEVQNRFGDDSLKPASLLRRPDELGPSRRRPSL
ncbi:MAG: DNA polymerase IV [Cryobacterium sp.]|nr:DNA polymerase IV [Cryobacterium sp.]